MEDSMSELPIKMVVEDAEDNKEDKEVVWKILCLKKSIKLPIKMVVEDAEDNKEDKEVVWKNLCLKKVVWIMICPCKMVVEDVEENKEDKEAVKLMHGLVIGKINWGSMQEGGKKDKRTFKVVSVAGKAVSFGTYTITKDSPIGPGRAATKAASSVCAHVTGKSGKHSISPQCNGVKFMLKEKTRGSSQKEYGPYKVVVHKRTPKELKDLEKRFKNFGKGKYKPSHHTASAVLVHNK